MAQTQVLQATSAADIDRAGKLLRNGSTVAFPTETVYGLGANALDPTAVAKIFAAKQRPSWDPLIVHVTDLAAARRIIYLADELVSRVELLAAAFWPGPLTLLLPKTPVVPGAVTAGRPLVGIRIPQHPVACAVLAAAGVPIAAPSANTFGHTSPTTAAHVLADLSGRIDAVLDGGATQVGLESTVLDPAPTPMVLYRPGAVTEEAIQAATGIEVQVFTSPAQQASDNPKALPSPGVGIRHYAPRARVILVEGTEPALQAAIETQQSQTGKLGVLAPSGWHMHAAVLTHPWGAWDSPEELATNLFAGLRALDDTGADIILCPIPPPGGLNDAIRDRLSKAAKPA